jgi:ssRNA-specific RNase YbeY (16S rRNA maturation enzyme)
VLIDLAAWMNFKVYKEFKLHNADIKNIQELNQKFRKEFGIPDIIPFPGDLDD